MSLSITGLLASIPDLSMLEAFVWVLSPVPGHAWQGCHYFQLSRASFEDSISHLNHLRMFRRSRVAFGLDSHSLTTIFNFHCIKLYSFAVSSVHNRRGMGFDGLCILAWVI